MNAFSSRHSLLTLISFSFAALAHASSAGQFQVNRTLPKVSPPKLGLEFSVNPTTQEIFRARVFEEPLVPIGGEPSAEENAALADALLGYAKRSGPDDFASLTSFLETHLNSPWRVALLTGLGFEYYNTAHYSLALEAWKSALAQTNPPTTVNGMVVLSRATEELALLYARLGRMEELEALLKPFANGSGSEKINRVRDGLWNMQHKPEISFKCGPYALQRILLSDQRRLTSAATNALMEIFNSASTQKGFSLPQVAELSRKVGLNYQMAFRSSPRSSRREEAHSNSAEERQSLLTSAATKVGDFVVPSVVHWKVGHYAAMVRQEGDKFLLEDPTFGNTVWATREALEAETSGYFLIPPGDLPRGWRGMNADEGASVWGKGLTSDFDGDDDTPDDLQTGTCQGDGPGMPVSSAHLMTVNQQIRDTPLAYTPPVGPPVRFTFRFNSRDLYATDRIFGGYYWSGFSDPNIYTCVCQLPNPSLFVSHLTRMTHDWNSYLVDSPQSPLANVKWVVGGGGARTFSGFNATNQTFTFQQFDQTLLKRTSTNSYEMTFPDGSKKIFGQPDGSVGSGRRVYLTQMTDPAGNALTFTYDQDLRLVAVTDAIGQVTTLTYGGGTNLLNTLVRRVTDPFGRFAAFDYEKHTIAVPAGILREIINGTNIIDTPQFVFIDVHKLTNMTDMLGLSSQLEVTDRGAVPNMTTPYGTTTFHVVSGLTNNPTFRSLETVYPDGSRDRVEFNQSTNTGVADFDPVALLPAGMAVVNGFSNFRNTFYWSRTACATSYGDYTKAKIYHWLHSETAGFTAGILESTKDPLENRVWYNYAGQELLGAGHVGSSDEPTKVGRVLDDGSTQLYTYAYDGFGHVTNSVDPLGRTFSYVYASNGIDLLEVRQTRGGNNELLSRMTYNAQHLPLTTVGADGQTNTFTYNARGQRLTKSNPKGETTAYNYDTNGYLIAMDGPLPGTNDVVSATYDALGRTQTKTDVNGYTLAFEYDNMDRLTKITHPDSTFAQFTYNRLDLTNITDRAGRQTLLEFDNVQQMKKKTDPLGRVTLFDWCRCGQIKSLTDPMGRITSWLTDVQGRVTAKQYGDGSQVKYLYENASSRLREVVDEKQQVSHFTWNVDDTLKSIAYANAAVPTPGLSYTYDPNYNRRISMTDGTGTSLFSYNPITASPALGANQLASVDGPLPNDTITYAYDELGRRVSMSINGVGTRRTYDAAGRVVIETNALGAFTFAYEGVSGRLVTNVFPNGLTAERGYGGNLQDRQLQRITHRVGATPVSEFLYAHDTPAHRMTTWSQQAGAQPPDLLAFSYDAADQLLSATVTNSGNLLNLFAYSYDSVANRLAEQVGTSNYVASYNALNQISASTVPGSSRTNEWDAKDRLVAVNAGNQRTEFMYDGMDRMVSIRQLTNGVEASFRQFVWWNNALCEERDVNGAITKRFFEQGMKLETGANPGNYFYTRDHLGSIRELTDGSGNVRARYVYDPYGRRSKSTGDLETDFGFTGLFFAGETGLFIARYRTYDSELGRWLSRDPLRDAEVQEGANLYAYVQNDPVNSVDPLGLNHCCVVERVIGVNIWEDNREKCDKAISDSNDTCNGIKYRSWGLTGGPAIYQQMDCDDARKKATIICDAAKKEAWDAYHEYQKCLKKPCKPCGP